MEAINECVYKSYQDLRSKLTHDLVYELGDNLQVVIALEILSLETGKRTPLWDVLLFDKFRELASLN